MDVNSKTDNSAIDNNTTIRFPEGLLGFDEYKEYRLFTSATEKDLHWLQPVDTDDIEFAVTFPSIFQVNYEVTLDQQEETLLDISNDDEIAVLVTLSKKPKNDDHDSFLNANFIAPIIINISKKLGLQKILNQQENPVTITMRG